MPSNLKYRASLLVLVLPLMLVPVVIAIRAGVYDSWFDNPINGFGMWGVFAVYLWTRPTRKESFLVWLFASALRTLHWDFANEHSYPGCSVINIGAYFPFLCLPLLAYRALKGPHKSTHRLSLGGVLLFSLSQRVSRLLCLFRKDRLSIQIRLPAVRL